MKKASLGALLALLTQLFYVSTFAQNAEDRWAIGGGPTMVTYKAHPGSLSLSVPTFSPAFQVEASRYLAGAFDFRTRISYSPKVAFPSNDAGVLANSMMADLSYNMVFKINNGLTRLEHNTIRGGLYKATNLRLKERPFLKYM